jgi:superkiller protein 3
LLTLFSHTYSHIFLGYANDKLNNTDESERAYINATRIKADDRTAWQGLISLYDKQGGNKLDAYHEAVIQLGKIFAAKYGVIRITLSNRRANDSQ